MKSLDEIIERYKAKNDDPDDMFGFYRDVLSEYIPLDRWVETGGFDEEKIAALTDDQREQVTKNHLPDEAAGTAEAIRYLEFAFGKADDHRGLSASRSVDKMAAHLWVLDHDLTEYDEAEYAMYGVPKLVVAARLLGAPVPDSPDLERMANGEPCHPGCESCLG